VHHRETFITANTRDARSLPRDHGKGGAPTLTL
jgi:hypothetical protein